MRPEVAGVLAPRLSHRSLAHCAEEHEPARDPARTSETCQPALRAREGRKEGRNAAMDCSLLGDAEHTPPLWPARAGSSTPPQALPSVPAKGLSRCCIGEHRGRWEWGKRGPRSSTTPLPHCGLRAWPRPRSSLPSRLERCGRDGSGVAYGRVPCWRSSREGCPPRRRAGRRSPHDQLQSGSSRGSRTACLG